jgi:imidazolonepropionase-like amidohydrolase
MKPIMPLIGVMVISACTASVDTAGSPKATDIAFVDVNVVDVDGERVLRGQTVLIRGSRIAAVGSGVEVVVPRDAHIVDGSDRFLIPGLVDMHVHLFNNVSRRSPNEWALPLFVANGVTGVREMWTEPVSVPTVREWLRGVEQATLIAPRVLATGALLNGPGAWYPHMPQIATPTEARDFVRTAAEAGVDFIKTHSLLRPEVYAAALDEARAVGLPVDGHIPLLVRALDAAVSGHRTNEHLYQIREACTTVEDQIMVERHRFYSAPYTEEAEVALLDAEVHRFGERFDPVVCRGVATRLAATGQWQVPTLVNERRWTFGPVGGEMWLAYMPFEERQLWMRLLEDGSVTYTGERESLRRSWEATLNVVAILEEAGLGVLAGTDFGNPFVFPGFSLHEELSLLVEAGLTPAQALKAATTRPAQALEMSDSLGSIAPSQLADLVLLAANPLEDIRNTRRIEAVVLNGRYLDRRALDALLANAASTQETKR